MTIVAVVLTTLAVAIMAACLVLLHGLHRVEEKIVERADELDAHVATVHDEVKTANGITMAALADRAEGRRIGADVPEADRTASEQGYVDNLEEGGRDGHGEPGDEQTAQSPQP